jgi:hypothetical protein
MRLSCARLAGETFNNDSNVFVTVTLEEDVARWARIEAARQDTSVSRLLGALLKERMSAHDDYQKVMRRALGRKPFLRSDARYLTREEAHDRARTR